MSSNGLPEKRHSNIGCICVTFPHCEFSYVDSKNLDQSTQIHIDCICLTFLHCAFLMCPQIACLRRGIVTLITFVFSTVCLFKGHNRIQRHIDGCIGLNFLQCVFSNMSQCISQMIPQILFPRESPKIAFYSGISNDTSKRFSMRERSPTVATSAATQPSKLII